MSLDRWGGREVAGPRRDSGPRPALLAMPRVLVVAPQPFYEDRGTPIAVRQFLEALSNLGHHADLLTYPVGQPFEAPRLRVIRAANPLGFRHVPIGLSLRKLILDFPLTLELRRRLRDNTYVCVHAVEEAAFPAVWYAKRRGIRVVYDMQSSLPEQLCERFPFNLRPLSWLLARAERWLLRRADFVVASSGLSERVRAVAPEARVKEWRFVSDTRTARPDEILDLLRTFEIPRGAPVVLYTGTFEPYQGLPDLLDAIPRVAAAVPKTVFLLVGGKGHLPHDQAAAMRKWLGSGTLRVVPRQPRDRMPSFFAISDVVVSTRKFGGNIPLKVFDYLTCGRPIVATDIPAHRAILDADRAVLVPPTADGMADAIIGLLREPASGRALAAAAKVWAEENCGSIAFTHSVGELYDEILSLAKQTAPHGR